MWSTIVLQSNGDAEALGAMMALGIFGFCIAIIPMILLVVTYVGLWKLFEKANQPGWAALIPIYNDYIRVQILGLPMQWFYYMAICYGLMIFLGGLLGIAPLVLLVLNFFMMRPFLRAFGQSDDTVNTVLYLFVPFIMYPRLGMGPATYQGFPSLHDVPALPWIDGGNGGNGGSTGGSPQPPTQPTNVPPVTGGPSDSGSGDAGSFIPSMGSGNDNKDNQ